MSASERVAPASFLKLSAEVASSYGFQPVREVEKSLAAAQRTRGAHTFGSVAGSSVALSRPGEPVLAFWASGSPGHMPASHKAGEVGEFGMQIVGAGESVGEVLLLKALSTIITEWGGTVARVRVNALGDRDSRMRFGRELSVYLRKRAGDLDEQCRERINDDPLAAYACATTLCKEVVVGGPRAMNFLSEKSRAHFREVLEHIEGLGLPYELDDQLMGDEREPRIAFAIDLEGEDATIVTSGGGRYDDHLRRISGKKDATGVGASIFFRKKGLTASHFSVTLPQKQPKIYFIQLGLQAKLHGLAVLDTLRRAQVPVLQSFNATQLGPQLGAARAAGVSHLLILGQREVLDGTIILRSMNNSSQEIVHLTHLPRHLKALK